MFIKFTNLKPLFAFIAGLAVSGIIGFILLANSDGDASHPIANATEEVHVHADFLFYIGNERIRLTAEEFQSTAEHLKHKSIHIHDGNDAVLHRHAEGTTFADLINSLGFNLTNDCLTMTDGTKHCSDENDKLMLIVKGELVPDITSYIFAEEDEILLYFGDPTNPRIGEYADNVSKDACIYSGTCPERGVPPPENCGLTCEVADHAE